MSESGVSKILIVQPKKSKQLLLFFVILHLLALIVVAWLDVSMFVRLLLWVGCLGSAYHLCWRVACLKSQNSIAECRLLNDQWSVALVSGAVYDVELLANTFISPVLVMLNFQRIGFRKRPYSLLLLRDSLSSTSFRRVRFCLYSL